MEYRGKSNNKGHTDRSENSSNHKNHMNHSNDNSSDDNYSDKYCQTISPFLSMWALLARSSFFKILMVLFFMGTVEVGLFWYRRQDINKIQLIFWAASGLIFLILLWTEDRMEGKGSYTIMRLRITGQQFFIVKTIYNILCLLLVFVVQICLAFWMIWKWRTDMELGQAAPQLYFFAFYGNRFLHCLLPMAETGKWIRNGLLVAAWGMQAAGMRGKSRYTLPVCLFMMAAYWFENDMGVNFLDVGLCIVSTFIIGKEIFCVNYHPSKGSL